MARSYSNDLRLRVAAAAGQGKSNRLVANIFGVSPSAVSKWSQRYRATGSADAKSPDLNPIEQVFAKLKHLLRKARERTVDHLWDRIGDLLCCFSTAECANYFRNSGYGST